MIIRSWRATATPDGAQRYAQHFEKVVLPKLSTLEGFRGAFVLLDDSREVVEIEDLTLWESHDSIRAFTGADTEVAVVDEVARSMLLDHDTTVTHRNVAFAFTPAS
jgi:heme-degrading monooxygenase HmoA